jgi:hypothetical protein
MFNETALADGLNHLRQALAERRLFAGHLLNPDEIAEISATSDCPFPPGWLMSGAMHPGMFELVWGKQPKLVQAANTFQTTNGLLYGVVVQQLGSWQHRFVVQLLGQEVEQFVRVSQGSPLRFSLSNAGGEQATVFEGPDDMRLTLPEGVKFPLLRSDTDNVAAVSADCMQVAIRMLRPDEVPAAGPGYPRVESVCVSFVHSPSFFALLQSSVENPEGRRLH